MKSFIKKISLTLIIISLVSLLQPFIEMNTANASRAVSYEFIRYNSREVSKCAEAMIEDLLNDALIEGASYLPLNKKNEIIKTKIYKFFAEFVPQYSPDGDAWKNTPFAYAPEGWSIPRYGLRSYLEQIAPKAFELYKEGANASVFLQDPRILADIDSAIQHAAEGCLNRLDGQMCGACEKILRQMVGVKKNSSGKYEITRNPNLDCDNDSANFEFQYKNMEDDFIKAYKMLLIQKVLKEGGIDPAEAVRNSCTDEERSIIFSAHNFGDENYRKIPISTYDRIISVCVGMLRPLAENNQAASLALERYEKIERAAIEAVEDAPQPPTWLKQKLAEVVEWFSRPIIERFGQGVFENQLFKDSIIFLTDSQLQKYDPSNKPNTDEAVFWPSRRTNDKLVRAIQDWVKLFRTLHVAIIFLALVRIGVLLIASSVNPSMRGVAKDDLYKVFAYAVVLLTTDFIFELLMDINFYIVKTFGIILVESVRGRGWGNVQSLAELLLVVFPIPVVNQIAAGGAVLQLVAILVGAIMGFVMAVKMFMRFISICFLYIISPFAGMLLTFKSTRQAFAQLFKELISQIFMPAIYAGIYTCAYVIVVKSGIRFFDVWTLTYVGPITRIMILWVVFVFGKKVQTLLGLAGTGFTPDYDNVAFNAGAKVATTVVTAGVAAATGGATATMGLPGAAGGGVADGAVSAGSGGITFGMMPEKFHGEMPEFAPGGQIPNLNVNDNSFGPSLDTLPDQAEGSPQRGYFSRLGQYFFGKMPNTADLTRFALTAAFQPFTGFTDGLPKYIDKQFEDAQNKMNQILSEVPNENLKGTSDNFLDRNVRAFDLFAKRTIRQMQGKRREISGSEAEVFNDSIKLSQDDVFVQLGSGNYGVIRRDTEGGISKIEQYDSNSTAPKFSYNNIDELKGNMQGNEMAEKLYNSIGGDTGKTFKAYTVVQEGTRTFIEEKKAKIDNNVASLKFDSAGLDVSEVVSAGGTISSLFQNGEITQKDILVKLPEDKGYAKVDSDMKITVFDSDGNKRDGYDRIDVDTLNKYVNVQKDEFAKDLYKMIADSRESGFGAYRVQVNDKGNIELQTGNAKIQRKQTINLQLVSNETVLTAEDGGAVVSKIYNRTDIDPKDALITTENGNHVVTKQDGQIFIFNSEGGLVESYQKIEDIVKLNEQGVEGVNEIYNALGGGSSRFEVNNVVIGSNGEVLLKGVQLNIDTQYKIVPSYKSGEFVGEQEVSLDSAIVSKIYNSKDVRASDVLVKMDSGYGLVKNNGAIYMYNAEGDTVKKFGSKAEVRSHTDSDEEAKRLYEALGGDDKESFTGYRMKKQQDGGTLMEIGQITFRYKTEEGFTPKFIQDDKSSELLWSQIEAGEEGLSNIYSKDDIGADDILLELLQDKYVLLKPNGEIHLFDCNGKCINVYTSIGDMVNQMEPDAEVNQVYNAVNSGLELIGYKMKVEKNGKRTIYKGNVVICSNKTVGLEFAVSNNQMGQEEQGRVEVANNTITILYNSGTISNDDVLIMLSGEKIGILKTDGRVLVHDNVGRLEYAYSDTKQVAKTIETDVVAEELNEILGQHTRDFIAFKAFEDTEGKVFVKKGYANMQSQAVTALRFESLDENESFNNSFIKTGISQLQRLIDFVCVKHPEFCERVLVVKGIACSKAIHYFLMLDNDNKLVYIGSVAPQNGINDGIYIGQVYIEDNPKHVIASNSFIWGQLSGEDKEIVDNVLKRVFSVKQDVMNEINTHIETANIIVDMRKAKELIDVVTEPYSEGLFVEFVTNSSRHVFITDNICKLKYVASLNSDEGIRYKSGGYKFYVLGKNGVLYSDGIVYNYAGFDLAVVQRKISNAPYFLDTVQNVTVAGRIDKKLIDIISQVDEGEFLWITNGPQNYVLEYSGDEKYEFKGAYHKEVMHEELQPNYTFVPFRVVKGKVRILNQHISMGIEQSIMFVEAMEDNEYEIIKQMRFEVENCKHILKQFKESLNKLELENVLDEDKDIVPEQKFKLTEDIEVITQRIEELNNRVKQYTSNQLAPMLGNHYGSNVGAMYAQDEFESQTSANIGIGDAVGTYEQTINNLERIRKRMLTIRRNLSDDTAPGDKHLLKKEFDELKNEYSKQVSTAKSLKSVINATKKRKKTNFDQL